MVFFASSAVVAVGQRFHNADCLHLYIVCTASVSMPLNLWQKEKDFAYSDPKQWRLNECRQTKRFHIYFGLISVYCRRRKQTNHAKCAKCSLTLNVLPMNRRRKRIWFFSFAWVHCSKHTQHMNQRAKNARTTIQMDSDDRCYKLSILIRRLIKAHFTAFSEEWKFWTDSFFVERTFYFEMWSQLQRNTMLQFSSEPNLITIK